MRNCAQHLRVSRLWTWPPHMSRVSGGLFLTFFGHAPVRNLTPRSQSMWPGMHRRSPRRLHCVWGEFQNERRTSWLLSPAVGDGRRLAEELGRPMPPFFRPFQLANPAPCFYAQAFCRLPTNVRARALKPGGARATCEVQHELKKRFARLLRDRLPARPAQPPIASLCAALDGCGQLRPPAACPNRGRGASEGGRSSKPRQPDQVGARAPAASVPPRWCRQPQPPGSARPRRVRSRLHSQHMWRRSTVPLSKA